MRAGTGQAMLELVAALKHDLAKYVAWRSANLEPSAWTGEPGDELVACLQADILSTHGDEPAWAVWDRHAAVLPRPLPAPELEAVAEAVETLRGYEDALRRADRAALGAGCEAIREAQLRIRRELQALHRRLVAG